MRGLTAERTGGTVQLRFTAPNRTTDDQPIRATTLLGSLCRQVERGACLPVGSDPGAHVVPVPGPGAAPELLWVDALSPDLAQGPPRVLVYRIALRSAAGRSGEASEPVYAVAGSVPSPVGGLSARGTRLGILLQWRPEPHAGEVLIERTALGDRGSSSSASSAAGHGGASQKNGTDGQVWLQAQPGNASASQTMDGDVQEKAPYSYVAVRRRVITAGGRSLEARSAPSAAVTISWQDVYPPATPGGLTAIGFDVPGSASSEGTGSAPGGYAVDLIWQPVDDGRLAGYLVYRQTLERDGRAIGVRTRLTPQPVTTPGFHDAGALPTARYRYGVTAIDPKGNEGAPAETTVQPAAAP